MRRTNKKSQDFVFVASGPMKRSGGLSTSGNSVNLADGQLAIMSADPWGTVTAGNFLTGGETPADVKAIKIVQGTSRSSNTSLYKGWNGKEVPAFRESPILRSGDIKSISCNVNLVGRYSSRFFGGTFSTVLASTDYGIFPVLRSKRKDQDFSQHEDDFNATFTTAATLPSGTAGVNLDYMLQNVLHQLNIQSKLVKAGYPTLLSGKKEVFGFALDIDGGGTGQALGTIAVGTVIPVMVYNGTTINYTATKEFVATVKEWIDDTACTTSTKIVKVDITTAGGSAVTDAFMLMGLEHDLAAGLDNEANVKVEVAACSTTSSFGTAYTETRVCGATEDQGSGRYVQIVWDRNAGLQSNLSVTGDNDQLVKTPSPIDTTKDYAVTVLDVRSNVEHFNAQLHNNKRIFIIYERVDNSAAVAATGFIRIINNAAIATDVVTVNGTGLTEGTDWNDGANAAATATSLAAEISTVSGVSATAYQDYVIITADTAGTAGNSITLAYTDTGSNGPAVELSGATLTGGAAAAAGSAGVTSRNNEEILVEDLNDVLGEWILNDSNFEGNILGASTSSALFV